MHKECAGSIQLLRFGNASKSQFERLLRLYWNRVAAIFYRVTSLAFRQNSVPMTITKRVRLQRSIRIWTRIDSIEEVVDV